MTGFGGRRTDSSCLGKETPKTGDSTQTEGVRSLREVWDQPQVAGVWGKGGPGDRECRGYLGIGQMYRPGPWISNRPTKSTWTSTRGQMDHGTDSETAGRGTEGGSHRRHIPTNDFLHP